MPRLHKPIIHCKHCGELYRRGHYLACKGPATIDDERSYEASILTCFGGSRIGCHEIIDPTLKDAERTRLKREMITRNIDRLKRDGIARRRESYAIAV